MYRQGKKLQYWQYIKCNFKKGSWTLFFLAICLFQMFFSTMHHNSEVYKCIYHNTFHCQTITARYITNQRLYLSITHSRTHSLTHSLTHSHTLSNVQFRKYPFYSTNMHVKFHLNLTDTKQREEYQNKTYPNINYGLGYTQYSRHSLWCKERSWRWK